LVVEHEAEVAIGVTGGCTHLQGSAAKDTSCVMRAST
jgi:hypothetical protein